MRQVAVRRGCLAWSREAKVRATAGRGGSSGQRGQLRAGGQLWAQGAALGTGGSSRQKERSDRKEEGGSDGGTKVPASVTSWEENMFTDSQ